MTSLPGYVDPELWAAFIDSRKDMAKKRKESFTDRAQLLLIKKLIRLHNEGFDPNSSLEASIAQSWKDLYPKDRYAVEPRSHIDPALAKILADDKKAAPMPAAIREKMKEWRK